MSATTGARLRALAAERRGVLVAGATNALSARLIQEIGFEALYLSGAGITNSLHGIPDLGFITLSELVQHTAAVREAVDLPIIVDADTGFGNALNVRHTVRHLERAGADCIQLEDQVSPKRCGHFNGKAVVPLSEMIGKLHAALDARRSADLLIMARTDARSVHGLDEALDRAAAFAQAGADITFVEAPQSPQELQRIAAELPCPQLVNVVIGGRTPTLPSAELGRMGFALVLYANAALQGAIRGMRQALGHLHRHGELPEDPALVATFAERQAVVQKDVFDELERRYGEPT